MPRDTHAGKACVSSARSGSEEEDNEAARNGSAAVKCSGQVNAKKPELKESQN